MRAKACVQERSRHYVIIPSPPHPTQPTLRKAKRQNATKTHGCLRAVGQLLLHEDRAFPIYCGLGCDMLRHAATHTGSESRSSLPGIGNVLEGRKAMTRARQGVAKDSSVWQNRQEMQDSTSIKLYVASCGYKVSMRLRFFQEFKISQREREIYIYIYMYIYIYVYIYINILSRGV